MLEACGAPGFCCVVSTVVLQLSLFALVVHFTRYPTTYIFGDAIHNARKAVVTSKGVNIVTVNFQRRSDGLLDFGR